MKKIFFRKTLVYMSTLILAAAMLMSFSMNVISEETGEGIPEYVMPLEDWATCHNGTYFEISNSSYLNISLTSSENIHLYLYSLPKFVSYHIESNCSATSTSLTLAGFIPNKTYYLSQNGILLDTFIADENGQYSYTQDISEPNHLIIEEETSTIFIQPDGTVNPPTAPINKVGNTYYVTEDILNDRIFILCSDIILDGQNHILELLGNGNTILVENVNNVVIKNFEKIKAPGGKGVWMNYAHYITVENCNIEWTYQSGISLDYCTYITMNHVIIRYATHAAGILLFKSRYITVNDSIIENNYRGGIFNIETHDYHIYDTIINNNDLAHQDKYWGIANHHTFGYKHVIGCTISNHGWGGIYDYYGGWTTVTDNIITSHNNAYSNSKAIFIEYQGSGNSWIIARNNISYNDFGIFHSNSENDIIYHNTFWYNTVQYGGGMWGWYYKSQSDCTWDNGAGEGNYWSDYTGVDDGSNGRTAGDGVGDTLIPHPYVVNPYYPGMSNLEYISRYHDNYALLDNYPLMTPWSSNEPPLADAGGPYGGYEGEEVYFDAYLSTDPDNDPLEYRWDFNNDGAWDTSYSTDSFASLSWYDDYTGDVVVEVFDGEYTDTAIASVTILNSDPWIVEPLADSYTTDEGSIITLGAYGGDDGTDDLTFTWSWGDGASDDSYFYGFGGTPPAYYLNQMSHSYDDNGDYTVTLTIYDDDGGFTSSSTTVTVNNVVPHSYIYGGIAITDGYILATTFYGESYFVDINENDGTFADPELIDNTYSWYCYGAGIGDFDNDGDYDALVGDELNTWYYEKIGEGNSFESAVSIEPVYRDYRMDFAEADFNNDGNLDAIMSEYYDGGWYGTDGITEFIIYLGNGDGTFSISTLIAPDYIMGIDSADFNGDGFMDFIAASSWYHGVYIYLGNGDGTFQSPINILYGLNSRSVCAGDFDNDGDDDFLFGFSEVYPYSNPVMFYPNNGDGTFGEPVNIGLPSFTYAIADGDIDNDGYLDIVFSTGISMWYYAGNGDGTFTYVSRDIIASSLYGIAAEAGTQEPLDAYEGELISFTGRFIDPGYLDTHTATWDWGDESPTEPGIVTEENLKPYATGEVTGEYTYGDNSEYTVTLTVTDKDGGIGDDNITITVYNVPPTITYLDLPLDPVDISNPVELTATFTDPGWLDTHIASIDWDDGNITNGDITDSDGSYTVTGSWIYGQAGVYSVSITVTDDDGGSDSMTFTYYVVVYDPTNGFVTGGGWINSPAGAYKQNAELTGKANFGFVSKYKKGQSTPTGNTEFNFKAGDLNFHSDDYEWLVIQIAGAKAMFKGIGTINGEGSYKFRLTGIDEKLTPSTDTDLFRIKIWEEDDDGNEIIIYDNNIIDDEFDSNPETEIGGGNIVIHKK